MTNDDRDEYLRAGMILAYRLAVASHDEHDLAEVLNGWRAAHTVREFSEIATAALAITHSALVGPVLDASKAGDQIRQHYQHVADTVATNEETP